MICSSTSSERFIRPSGLASGDDRRIAHQILASPRLAAARRIAVAGVVQHEAQARAVRACAQQRVELRQEAFARAGYHVRGDAILAHPRNGSSLLSFEDHSC